MLYYKCPSCRTILANKQIPFDIEMNIICNMDISEDEKNKKKQDLLNKLQVINVCCRMRILTYVKEIDIIK